MRKIIIIILTGLFSITSEAQNSRKVTDNTTVTTLNGAVRGTTTPGGIIVYKGIPFARPPVGDLRWKAPQPVENWKLLVADHFGPRPFQRNKYEDMIFRSSKESEDCLYLNIWKPTNKTGGHLPVLVYFYGGGFSSGDGSEARYDGESMAKKGVISITVNYRLSVFGFLAHPGLTKESAHHSSGNYGLMDQHEALKWIRKNIAAFGGDPERITIAGESAGSMSVSAQMASPLSKGLFHGAIAQSGSLLGIDATTPLAEAEKNGLKFAGQCGASNLAELRKIPAGKLLQISKDFWFPPTIDGYFFPRPLPEIFSTGKQMDIPLLAGWTTAERGYESLIGNGNAPTAENFKKGVLKAFGDQAEDILKIYAVNTDEDVPQVALDLESDRFIAYGTWKFIDLHSKTNGFPVYRYIFARKRPKFLGTGYHNANPLGAVHASDIEYALGNLSLNDRYAWTEADFKTSETMQAYLVNFIRSGDPNGPGLAKWYGLQSSIPKVMTLDSVSGSSPEKNGRRYAGFDKIVNPDK